MKTVCASKTAEEANECVLRARVLLHKLSIERMTGCTMRSCVDFFDFCLKPGTKACISTISLDSASTQLHSLEVLQLLVWNLLNSVRFLGQELLPGSELLVECESLLVLLQLCVCCV